MTEKSAKEIRRLYQAGQALVRKQKYDQAIAKFKRITGSDLHTLLLPGAADKSGTAEGADADDVRPVYVQAHVSLAVCYTEKGMFQEAINVLHRASQIDPENADALCALGYVYRRSGMVEQAIEAFERALQCDPQCVRAQTSLAFLAMEQGRFEDAIALCREAIQADPTDEAAYLELAGALQLAGRSAEALEVLQKALALNPDNADHLLRYFSLLRDNGLHEEAAKALETALAFREDPALCLALAECYLDLDRPREARSVCQRLLRQRPRDLRALELLQKAYLKEGNIQQALRIACRLTILCPQDPLNFFRKAVLYQQLGDIRQAMDNYARVMELDDGTGLSDYAEEAIDLLDGLQLRQILMLARDDGLFRAKLRRNPREAADERGFHLSDAGIATLEQLELKNPSELPPAWLRKQYH